MANKREACVDSNKKLSAKQARKFRLSISEASRDNSSKTK